MERFRASQPQAPEDILTFIDDISTTICIGISQSRRTLETVTIMNALRERVIEPN
jgi:DNA-binding MurR/RpiR family transcriptional regulator